MENVMTNAWVIARKGQNKFGGKVKEYFAKALKISWAIFKKEDNTMLSDKIEGKITTIDLPTLEGSEKQVSWASNIRAKAFDSIKSEIIFEDWEEGQPKRKVYEAYKALLTKESTEEYLSDLPDFLVEKTIATMNGIIVRNERFNEIMSQSDAKFWIDNRDNQDKNYMFDAFKKYISNGNKNF